MKTRIGQIVLATSPLLKHSFLLKIEKENKFTYIGEILEWAKSDEYKVKDFQKKIAVRKNDVKQRRKTKNAK
ncbi:hypothetical protein SAMN02745116_02378 [Pilibacter termitis]|jgi:uncharacterized protein (UPF0335 family)|uniref:Uncharacterized protein n=1 Tax=Pilibacter termitis TaxID=263852 RepID=A0A1T4QZ97_9ENTE|nr:hypothetical protein [Pilibacter termitis]SKA08927.1 hypothetical protein SAMN02745116_02378 [Pilibacter termitis]